ncbi:hypothetical protein cyc_03763 [Cyclospora cayetanensis]|uniref:Uncharacterized protein n=1 Tax=Cyclospora cayetanensis TaxID=88456 RepID=A0A1D3CY12_9EIME|nr:hypothetical protein cyc_03763 [Cyclospora cayetanensis]
MPQHGGSSVKEALTVAAARPHSAGNSPASVGHVSDLHNAYPEVPLHFYRATDFSTSSINHRMFYVNLVLLLFIWDCGSAMLDL